MSGIYGVLGLEDNNRDYVNTIGQRLVFEAAQEYLRMHNEDLQRAYQVFVESETTDHSERYLLPGGGRLQRRGGYAQSAATKASGSWDVAYPLEDFGAQIAATDISMAYMTMPEYNRHIESVRLQDINTHRYEILHALLDNTNATFEDPHGLNDPTLTIRRLANGSGDGVLYPPVIGSETSAVRQRYNVSGYAATDISDTNNPYVTIQQALEDDFGEVTGGDSIVVFVNRAEVPETQDLSDFIPVEDSYIRLGNDADVPVMLPTVPGRVIGRANGCWIVQWSWMPATYMLGIHLEAPAPLKRRVDDPSTGLMSGLQLIEGTNDRYPFEQSHYRDRFGYGVGNRLNGYVLELTTDGTYTVPVDYD